MSTLIDTLSLSISHPYDPYPPGSLLLDTTYLLKIPRAGTMNMYQSRGDAPVTGAYPPPGPRACETDGTGVRTCALGVKETGGGRPATGGRQITTNMPSLVRLLVNTFVAVSWLSIS